MKNLFEEVANMKHWNELAEVHYHSYGIERLFRNESMMTSIELAELADIKRKKILHLQCHIGTDTLSLEKEGAVVTGIDFSEKSIQFAEKLCRELNLSAKFIVGNILHLDEIHNEQYDVIYTGKGALCWISDIKQWAANVAKRLGKGGYCYVYEFHPFAWIFDEANKNDLAVRYPYFSNEPLYFDEEGVDYADPAYTSRNPTFEWMWSVSEILNSLIEEDLELEFFNEHASTVYPMFPFLKEDNDGYWRLPEEMAQIPLMYSLKARKK